MVFSLLVLFYYIARDCIKRKDHYKIETETFYPPFVFFQMTQ